MVARKLKALGYHHPDDVNLKDELQVRNLIVWLEDQRIRFYKIEDREALRNVTSVSWVAALKKYLTDLSCPVSNIGQKGAVVGWLIGHAVRLEYHTDASKYNTQHEEREKRKQEVNQGEGEGGLASISGDDPDLKAGITSVSKLLNLPHHDDHMVLLQAISKMVESRLSSDAIAKSKVESAKKKPKLKEIDYLPLQKTSLGFDTNDSAINEAAKVIRLLQIHELRELQTRINEAIVTVQRVTADPKTDQSLGRVGR